MNNNDVYVIGEGLAQFARHAVEKGLRPVRARVDALEKAIDTEQRVQLGIEHHVIPLVLASWAKQAATNALRMAADGVSESDIVAFTAAVAEANAREFRSTLAELRRTLIDVNAAPPAE